MPYKSHGEQLAMRMGPSDPATSRVPVLPDSFFILVRQLSPEHQAQHLSECFSMVWWFSLTQDVFLFESIFRRNVILLRKWQTGIRYHQNKVTTGKRKPPVLNSGFAQRGPRLFLLWS